MTGITFPGGSVGYAWDSLSRRTSVTRGNGTTSQYAYEIDGDLDWMRHVFAGGATASAPARW
jgi:YD repeat-containing protein